MRQAIVSATCVSNSSNGLRKHVALMLLALLISLVAAILPTYIYTSLFYWADRYEREPRALVLIAFFWGAIPAVIASLIAELAIGAPFVRSPDSLNAALVEGTLVAPVIEETRQRIGATVAPLPPPPRV